MMLGVITSFFNFSDNPWMSRNYREFSRQMSDTPFFTVELSFTGDYQTDAILKIEAGDNHPPWQKERLLNLLVDRLPPEIDSLAWVDSNILFLNPDWYQQTEQALQDHPVVQPFSSAYWLDKKGAIEQNSLSQRASSGYWSRYPRPYCGCAWAMRRESWDQIGGLFDSDIVGGGDVWMAHAFYSEKSGQFLRQTSRTMFESFAKYIERCHQVFQGHVGNIRGDILHMYQGELNERLFWVRHQAMKHYCYNPLTDIDTSTSGLLQWTGKNQKLERQIPKLLDVKVISKTTIKPQ